MTATAESVLLLLLPCGRCRRGGGAGLLLVVQMWVLLDGHRGRGGRGEAQGRARRTDRGRAEASRFHVQRWRGFVIHFHSIYLPAAAPSPSLVHPH